MDIIFEIQDGARLEVVQSWLDAGGDVNAAITDSDGFRDAELFETDTLLRVAIKYSRTDLIRYLLSRGAAANDVDQMGLTVLHTVSFLRPASAPEIVSLLLAAGANVNARDLEGLTPLSRFLYYGKFSPEVAALLLRAGALVGDWAEDYMREREAGEPALASDEDWNAIKVMVAGVSAAGSWKAYCRLDHKKLFVLRALVARGRATTTSRTAPSVKWLLGAGSLALPDEIAWKILSFWRATE